MIQEETNEIFSLDTNFFEWNEGLLPGQHVYPFAFKIPSYSPSSFYFSGEDDKGNYIKAEVFYHVSVKLIQNSNIEASHSRIIIIKNRNTLDKPSIFIEKNEIITGCCFANKGSTKLKLSIKNTEHCQVEGKINYKLDPDNSLCKVPINHVTGAIILEFSVNTLKAEFKIRRVLNKIERATWISAFTSLVYEKDFEYEASLTMSSEELNPSTNATPLIKCEYFVEVSIFYDIAFRTSPFSVKLPFHVNPKNTFRKEDPRLPTDWNPVESSIYNFVVNNQSASFVSDSMSTFSDPNTIN